MASINLLQKASVFNDENQSYRLTIQAISSQDIIKYIFVKQRIYNYKKNNTEDVFRAIATPAQLADFGVQSPREGSTYFLDDNVDLISRDGFILNDLAEDVLNQIKKLVDDVNALNILSNEENFEIS